MWKRREIRKDVRNTSFSHSENLVISLVEVSKGNSNYPETVY
jgi:hypothetical protein